MKSGVGCARSSGLTRIKPRFMGKVQLVVGVKKPARGGLLRMGEVCYFCGGRICSFICLSSAAVSSD
jgi:hypothetical protein